MALTKIKPKVAIWLSKSIMAQSKYVQKNPSLLETFFNGNSYIIWFHRIIYKMNMNYAKDHHQSILLATTLQLKEEGYKYNMKQIESIVNAAYDALKEATLTNPSLYINDIGSIRFRFNSSKVKYEVLLDKANFYQGLALKMLDICHMNKLKDPEEKENGKFYKKAHIFFNIFLYYSKSLQKLGNLIKASEKRKREAKKRLLAVARNVRRLREKFKQYDKRFERDYGRLEESDNPS